MRSCCQSHFIHIFIAVKSPIRISGNTFWINSISKWWYWFLHNQSFTMIPCRWLILQCQNGSDKSKLKWCSRFTKIHTSPSWRSYIDRVKEKYKWPIQFLWDIFVFSPVLCISCVFVCVSCWHLILLCTQSLSHTQAAFTNFSTACCSAGLESRPNDRRTLKRSLADHRLSGEK